MLYWSFCERSIRYFLLIFSLWVYNIWDIGILVLREHLPLNSVTNWTIFCNVVYIFYTWCVYLVLGFIPFLGPAPDFFSSFHCLHLPSSYVSSQPTLWYLIRTILVLAIYIFLFMLPRLWHLGCFDHFLWCVWYLLDCYKTLWFWFCSSAMIGWVISCCTLIYVDLFYCIYWG